MTGLTVPMNDEMQALANEHQEWLASFDPRYLKKWRRDLETNDNEAAMAEASVRRRLQQFGVTVEPNEDLVTGKKAVDFRCECSGLEFYVEVTCIRIETAVKYTGVPNVRRYEGTYRSLNLKVFHKCVQKATQASSVDAPVLVAIGTWHSSAAMQLMRKNTVNRLLTGEPSITWDINISTGKVGDTCLTTNLWPAIFLKLDDDKDPSAVRKSISGVLLFAFGMPGIQPLVVLNPNANHPFSPAALAGLEYGTVIVDSLKQQLHVSWTKEPSDGDKAVQAITEKDVR